MHSPAPVSVLSLGPGEHKVCSSPLSVSGSYGVWFEMWFCSSYHLARASPSLSDMGYLLKVAPALHSCHSSAYGLAGASLPLDVGVSPCPNYGGGNEDNGDLLQKVPCIHCCTHKRCSLTFSNIHHTWRFLISSTTVPITLRKKKVLHNMTKWNLYLLLDWIFPRKDLKYWNQIEWIYRR